MTYKPPRRQLKPFRKSGYLLMYTTEIIFGLGMVNHYSKFLKCLADLSAPLNNLLKKEVPWEWTEQHQTSFEKIKQALTTTPVLTHFDPDIPIGLACDASAVGMGCDLPQVWEWNQEIHSICLTIKYSEKNYS